MSGKGITPQPIAIPPAPLRDLRSKGIALECAASSFTGAVQRCEAGQESPAGFEIAAEAHNFARDEFRAALQDATGLSAATVERWLAL